MITHHDQVIAHHMDHAPQVKALVDELYEALSASGRQNYENAIEAEYCTGNEEIRHRRIGDGVVSVVRCIAHDGAPGHVIDLIYGNFSTQQIREDLVAHGVGFLPIVRVYPSHAVLPAEDDA
jgi:hypothetical protein